ncbi:MAG: hypothetical protein OEZ36_09200 [Spirochaetota bacterium]|nr:hypothetical protein [Spirochaetota bacterium]
MTEEVLRCFDAAQHRLGSFDWELRKTEEKSSALQLEDQGDIDINMRDFIFN